MSRANTTTPSTTPAIRIAAYDVAALRAMARATAYDPLPTEPDEQRLPYSDLPYAFVVAENKPAPTPTPTPDPATKPAYEPLPTEVDTRENKPGKQK